MRKFSFISIFIFLSALAHSQSLYAPLHDQYNSFNDQNLNRLGLNFHTSVKPYIQNDTQFVNNTQIPESLLRFRLKKNAADGSEMIMAYPLLQGGISKTLGSPDTTLPEFGAGAMAAFTWKNKLTVYADYFFSQAKYLPYVHQRFDTAGIVPGFGLTHIQNNAWTYQNWNAYISYSPVRYFNFQLGKGKNFWGDGYRSLFLSDNANNYPYFKITTTVWKIKYVNLYQMLDHITGANGIKSNFQRKYTSLHYLSFNIGKRINLNLFEAVVWQAKDTLQNRGYDVNYLNPVIFFRPVEYALGSSDNSIIGAGFKVKINNNNYLYGQFLLDEFLLKEIKADSGWWANKYAYQIGLKAHDIFKIKNLSVQTEYNYCRPFTYSHGSPQQNYGHFNQPLAHPVGANFKEWVNFVRYNYKWIYAEEQVNITVYGTDSSYQNFGGNIFQSYRNRVHDYHNYTAQGNTTHVLYHRFTLGFLLNPDINLRLEIGHALRRSEDQFGTNTTNWVFVTLKTNLFNQYLDY